MPFLALRACLDWKHYACESLRRHAMPGRPVLHLTMASFADADATDRAQKTQEPVLLPFEASAAATDWSTNCGWSRQARATLERTDLRCTLQQNSSFSKLEKAELINIIGNAKPASFAATTEMTYLSK